MEFVKATAVSPAADNNELIRDQNDLQDIDDQHNIYYFEPLAFNENQRVYSDHTYSEPASYESQIIVKIFSPWMIQNIKTG